MGFFKSLGKAALGAVGGAVGGLGSKSGMIGGAVSGALGSLGKGGGKGGGFSGPIKAAGKPSVVSDDPSTGGISGRLGAPDIQSSGYGGGKVNISRVLRASRDRKRPMSGKR